MPASARSRAVGAVLGAFLLIVATPAAAVATSVLAAPAPAVAAPAVAAPAVAAPAPAVGPNRPFAAPNPNVTPAPSETVLPNPATAPSPVQVDVESSGTTAPAYRIEVRNGSGAAVDATVRQELPQGTAPTEVSPGGQVSSPGGQAGGLEVSWRLQLAAGTAATLATTLSPPVPATDVTAPTCVYPGDGTVAYDCATASWAAPGTEVEAAPPWWRRPATIIGALAALALIVLAVAGRRWQTARRPRGGTARPGVPPPPSPPPHGQRLTTPPQGHTATAPPHGHGAPPHGHAATPPPYGHATTPPAYGQPASAPAYEGPAATRPQTSGQTPTTGRPQASVHTAAAMPPRPANHLPASGPAQPAGPDAGGTGRPSQGGGGIYRGGRRGRPTLVGDEPPASQPGAGAAGGPIRTPQPGDGPAPRPARVHRRIGPPVWVIVGAATAALLAAMAAVAGTASARVTAISADRRPSSGAWVGEATSGPVGATMRDSSFEFTVYRITCPPDTGRCEATVGLHNVSGHDQPWHGALQRAYLPDGNWVTLDETATMAANAGRDLFAEPVPADQKRLFPLVFAIPGAEPPTRIELRGDVFSAGVSVDVP